MKTESNDLVIIGTGPAGLSAAIYAARYKIDFLIIGGQVGGNMCESCLIENYPGFEKPLTGERLAQKMEAQLKKLGHNIIIDDIGAVAKTKEGFILSGTKGSYETKKLLLALGMATNKLNVPGEAEFLGRGVSYCATCDGYFFKGKTVAVVGGGDAAATSAIFLADIAKKVYLIVRRNELRADPFCQTKLKKNPKVEIIFETNIKEIAGKEKVEKVVLDKDNRSVELDGVFIEIGQTPQDILFRELGIKQNDKGLVSVDGAQKTSVQSIWAAGDMTTNSNNLRQIVTAASEGAVATVDIFSELKKSK